MASSPFVVDITDLLRGATGTRPEQFTAPVTWRLGETTIDVDPPLDIDLTLVRVSGGIVVFGTATATARSVCDRCLVGYETELSAPVQVSLLFEVDDDDEDAYIIDSPKVDLEPMIRDEVLLGLPVRSLCTDNCAGLVEHAESDLNTDAHDTEATGSPFSILRELLETRE
ncbi:hypothetical protein BMS3Bbin02_01993 [bacterium BMS3Bbin02]|nr:hypothetical protein BMS3Bbin02_01993 [bacterium BMS3Bbin02]